MLRTRGRFGRAMALAGALALLFVAGASNGSAQSMGATTRYTKTFTVTKAPEGAWEVYVTDTIVPPGAWTGAHTHPGPEFGLIAAGMATRWDNGLVTQARTGYGYYSAPNEIHEGGNTNPDSADQISVHLIPKGGDFAVNLTPEKAPAGAPKPVLTSKRLWQAKYDLATHPAPPFQMTQTLSDFAANTSTSYKRSQMTLMSVLSGSVDVTQNGKVTTYATGSKWVEQAGDSVSVANGPSGPASTFAVAFAGPKK